MLEKLKGLFVKNKIENPIDVIGFCMGDICNMLLSHFSKEYYKWEETKGVKTFECLVLSKFIIDHVLLTSFIEKIDETRIKFYLEMVNVVFKTILETTLKDSQLTHDALKDTIINRLVMYSDALTENPHPACWQKITGICTGIDYHTQKDLYTLVSASTMLPELLKHAQDTLKLLIKQ